MKPNFEAAALPVAMHEAGHNIIARALGFAAEECTATVNAVGHQGSSSIRLVAAIRSLDELRDYLRRRIKVLYAGAFAEAYSNGVLDVDVANRAIRERGGQWDYSRIRELVQLLRNVEYPDAVDGSEIQRQLSELDTELAAAAQSLVETDGRVIQAVGRRLVAKCQRVSEAFTLSGEEIEAIPAVADRFGAK